MGTTSLRCGLGVELGGVGVVMAMWAVGVGEGVSAGMGGAGGKGEDSAGLEGCKAGLLEGWDGAVLRDWRLRGRGIGEGWEVVGGKWAGALDFWCEEAAEQVAGGGSEGLVRRAVGAWWHRVRVYGGLWGGVCFDRAEL